MRHNRRRTVRHPGAYYVTPVRVSGGGRDSRGFPLPETRTDLPEALFAPGVSTEEGLLSDVSEQKAQLFFHEHVPVASTDLIEFPDPFGVVQVWRVSGRVRHWPKGTEVALEVQ